MARARSRNRRSVYGDGDGGVVITGQSWDLEVKDEGQEGDTYISIVTIRYAPDGTELWQRLENADYAHASGQDVAAYAEGRIYVSGYGYNFSFQEDLITLGYSPDGELLWTQIYANPEPEGSDYPQAIAVDDAENVFVAAHSWSFQTSNDFTTIRYKKACLGDINNDSEVNVRDLLDVLIAWGPCGAQPCPQDINEDDFVDVLDLLVVLNSWGPCDSTRR